MYENIKTNKKNCADCLFCQTFLTEEQERRLMCKLSSMTSYFLWDGPFQDSISASVFMEPSRCTTLTEQRLCSAHRRRRYASLFSTWDQSPSWWFIYATTFILSQWTRLWRPLNSDWNSFKARNTAIISRPPLLFRNEDVTSLTCCGPWELSSQRPLLAELVIHLRRRMCRRQRMNCE